MYYKKRRILKLVEPINEEEVTPLI